MTDGGGHEGKPESVGADSLPRAIRDLIDLGNESAGRETGRARRFSIESPDALNAKEREKEKEKSFNELMRLLQDPEYAKLYNDTLAVADRASDAVRIALEKNGLESAEAQQQLQEIEDSAATLPDGRKVFRSEDGRLLAEDGTDVSDQSASVTGLSDRMPSWEEYARAKERADALAREREEIERYRRDVLDPARARLNDPDNPYDKDGLRKTRHDLEEQMPPSVQAAYEQNAPVNAASKPSEKSAADEYLGAYDLPTPDVALQFVTARDAQPAETPAAAPSPATAPKVS